jgi:hypothetical protein
MLGGCDSGKQLVDWRGRLLRGLRGDALGLNDRQELRRPWSASRSKNPLKRENRLIYVQPFLAEFEEYFRYVHKRSVHPGRTDDGQSYLIGASIRNKLTKLN